MAAFTSSTRRKIHRQRSHRHIKFQLKAQPTKQKDPCLETDVALGDNDNSGDMEYVQVFDADLANEIKYTVLNAGAANEEATNKDVNGLSTKEITKHIIRPDNKVTQTVSELPPHTALAQVVANQYGIDLMSVSPSSYTPGSKITAEDVEFHAWKISQPPCTSEALEQAYSLGLDLNGLYDDEDREYVMQLSDVELFLENERSLKMSSQTKKGINNNNMTKIERQRAKKMSALDKRMGQNMVKLSEKAMQLAGTVASGILQQVQLKASEKLEENAGVFVNMNGKNTDDITAVEDFDTNLAYEIQQALSSANAYDEGIEDVKEKLNVEDIFVDANGKVTDDTKAVEVFDTNLASDIQEALSSASDNDEGGEDINEKLNVEDSFVDLNDKNPDDITAVEDFDTNLAYEIQEALSSANASDEGREGTDKKLKDEDVFVAANDKVTDDTTDVEVFDTNLASEIPEAISSATTDGGDGKDTNTVVPPATKEELQSMTCVQLKDQLRQRGMKVSGRKAELVDRLFDVRDADDGGKR